MVLGPKSISIKTPFSIDLTEKSEFQYQKQYKEKIEKSFEQILDEKTNKRLKTDN